MKLVDLISPDRVVLPLEAPTLTAAAWTLAERLAATGGVADLEKLQSRMTEERGEDIVALGDRAFLTHYRTDAVHDLAMAIGVSPTPIAREVGEAAEAQQARIVLLILAPPRLAARYLQVLGAFARLLSKPEAIEAILAATVPQELVTLPALQQIELPPHLTVREIMTERPRTTRPDMPIRDAAREMVRVRVGALPVVDADGLLIGMLSERELMRHMLSSATFLGGGVHRHAGGSGSARGAGGGSGEQGQRHVRDVMTRQVLCVSPDQPLAEVASLMANKDVDQVPVVRDGRLVGFLTRGDIVRKLIGS